MEPKAHESRKIQPMPNEICHDGDTRPDIPKTPNSKKLDPQDEIPNALMPKKPNDALRMQEPRSTPSGMTNDKEYIISQLSPITLMPCKARGSEKAYSTRHLLACMDKSPRDNSG